LPTAIASGFPPKVVPCVPGFSRCEAGAHWKAAADALGDGHDVGPDAGPFMGEELARTPDAGLNLVEDQKQAVLVAELPKRAQPLGRDGAHTAFALHRLDHDRARLRPDRRLQRLDIVERHLVEALHLGAEALNVLGLTAGRDRGEGAPVESALERDDVEALGLAVHRMILARHLDGGLVRLGARIGEEHHIGEGRVRQTRRELLAGRVLIQVRQVPNLGGLARQRLDEMGMRMAERVDRDAGPEIEIASPIGRDEPGALSVVEGEIGASIDRQNR
jgi:hypothetical protein